MKRKKQTGTNGNVDLGITILMTYISMAYNFRSIPIKGRHCHIVLKSKAQLCAVYKKPTLIMKT